MQTPMMTGRTRSNIEGTILEALRGQSRVSAGLLRDHDVQAKGSKSRLYHTHPPELHPEGPAPPKLLLGAEDVVAAALDAALSGVRVGVAVPDDTKVNAPAEADEMVPLFQWSN